MRRSVTEPKTRRGNRHDHGPDDEQFAATLQRMAE